MNTWLIALVEREEHKCTLHCCMSNPLIIIRKKRKLLSINRLKSFYYRHNSDFESRSGLDQQDKIVLIYFNYTCMTSGIN